MERLTIEELIEHCDRQMNRIPSGNKCYQEHESVRAYLQILRHYIATELTPEAAAQLKQIAEIFNCDPNDPAQLKQLCNKLRGWQWAEQDGWLVVLPEDKARWIKAILDERDRQDQKWGFPQDNTYGEWGSILAEEAGELCKELNELNFGSGDPGKMETEAVQVAAVALSILEHAAVAHDVTVQVAEALGRLTRQEAEAAVERKEENT